MLGCLPLLAASAFPSEAKSKVFRVNGAVTPKNFKGLEAFLLNSMDTVIGLRIRFEASEDPVSASLSDGKFVAYLSGEDAQSEIVANKGFVSQHGGYDFDGFFVVKSGGMHQGIISLFLDAAADATVLLSGAKIIDVDINRLRADIRK